MFTRGKKYLLAMLLVVGVLLGGLLASQASEVKGDKIQLYEVLCEASLFDFIQSTIIPDYIKENPNVRINITCLPLPELEKKIAIVLPARISTLDVFGSLGIGPLFRYYETGYIASPPDYVVDYVKESMPDWMLEAFPGGDIFAVPTWQSQYGLFWNKTHFAEAGISGAPESWDEMVEAAQKLVKYNPDGSVARSGISLRLRGAAGISQKFSLMLHTAGGSILTEFPGRKFRSNLNNQAGWDTLELHIDLLYKYKVDDYVVKHDYEAFALGMTSMFQRGDWVVAYLRDQVPELNYDTAIVPYKTVKTSLAWLGNTAVAEACKHQKEAWDWVLFKGQPKYGKLFFENEFGYMPAATKVIDFSDVLAKFPQWKVFIAPPADLGKWKESSIPLLDEIYQVTGESLEAAFKDKSLLDNPTGIKRVMAEIDEKNNRIIEEAGLLAAE